jgi:spore photoproduct lyase
MSPPFDRVVVDERAAELPFGRRFLAGLPPGLPVTVARPGAERPKGRRTVHLCTEPGAFLKPCPCTPGAVRCGYSVLTLGFQCPYACSYCFLRFYAPDEPLALYANLEAAEEEFLRVTAASAGPLRVGTGEFTDSLALDPWTRHSVWLRRLAALRPHVLLELKTKSDRVDLLLEGSAGANVVVAWSLNPPARIASDEPETATLEARLAAASRVLASGYPVAFHFDPIVLDGEGEWRREYAEVARRLFEAVAPRRIAWISLGTLRFPPRFLERWGARLMGRAAFFAEFVPGEDGKLRYFRALRAEAYRFLASELRRLGGDGLSIYLCMEPDWMWSGSLGWAPSDAALGRYLARGPALPATAGSRP